MGLRSIGAAGLAAVALGAVGVAWMENPPELTAGDAAEAAQGAFEAAGVDATVTADPVRATYASRTRPPVDVWSVLVTVRESPVELQLERAGARPVSIDDRTLDGSSYVLSELEYSSVARHVEDPALARSVRRNLVLTLAAVLVVALALAHAASATTRKETVR